MLVTTDVNLAIQLTKIMYDNKAAFAVEDSCKVARPSYYENSDMFTRDLILNVRPGIPLKSKLLDEDYNKGIYIDISEFGSFGQRFVRLPDAAMLNAMTKNLPTGELVYPRIADLMSRILQVCMEKTRSNLQLIGNMKNYQKTGRPGGLIARYMTEVRQLLHTRENYMKTLIQPVSSGVSPKQMADKFVPEGVCVILHDHSYQVLERQTWGAEEVHPDDFYVMGLRNPVLWQSQVTPLKVWDRHKWSNYLKAYHNVDLDDYIDVEFCRHLFLMNVMDVMASQADCDGDLYPVSVIPGMAAQEEFASLFDEREIRMRLSDTKTVTGKVRVLPTVHEEELNWIFGKEEGDNFYKGYLQGEVDSDAKLYDHEVKAYVELAPYKLNTIAFSWKPVGEFLPYNKMLASAVIAKNKVATGTLELWYINSGTDIFRHYWEKGIQEHGDRAAYKRRDTIQGLLANNGVLTPYTAADWSLMSHMYSRIVQDFIVRGKHTCLLSQ